jgi:hypothetical protein
MKTRRILNVVILAIALALINISTTLADGTPPIADSFYGPVKINGHNVPVGTVVSAYCNNTQVASSDYLVYQGDTVYSLNVPGLPQIPGCADGETIYFHIGILVADQKPTWSSGHNYLLPLTVTDPTAAPVTISGDAGIGGATISYTGGSTTANGSGLYSFTVDAGWTGAVSPALTGYTFNPANRTYINVMDNQPDQNYIATMYVPAPPPIPASFYGTVKSNGFNVPIFTQVSARINGIQYATSPYSLFNGDTVYSLNVPGDDPSTPGVIEGGVPGDTVVFFFFVGGKQANQTAIWQTGINVNLNLTVALPEIKLLYLPLILR